MTITAMMARAKADYDAVYEAGKRHWGTVLKYEDVESNSHVINVPSNSNAFARVNKIGGMSYRANNKIPFPYTKGDAGYSEEINGVTFTILADGGISMVGTPTEEFSWDIFKADTYNDYDEPIITVLPLVTGNYYTLSGAQSGIVRLTSTLTYSDSPHGQSSPTQWCESIDESAYLNYEFWQGYRVNTISLYLPASSIGTEINTIVYPMLNEGTTALPYEPYFAGLRSASVSELKSVGVNLFNAKNITVPSISVNEDSNEILMPFITEGNGFVSTDMKLSELCPSLQKGEVVVIHYDTDVPSGNEAFGMWLVGSEKLWFTNQETTITQEDLNSRVGLYGNRYSDGYTKQVTLLNFRIVRDFDTEFKPYIEDTLAIPEAVKSLDGYGLGVNSEYYNYIDFERKVFVQRVKRIEFDGTEDWSVGDTEKAEKWRLRFTIPDNNIQFESVSAKSNLLCNNYETKTAGDTWMNVPSIANHGYDLYIYDEYYTDRDVSLWKSHLAELYANDNPLIVDYALAEPIETDISSYLLRDEYIEVEGGGTITAVNEYGYDAPTNISYLINTQGG